MIATLTEVELKVFIDLSLAYFATVTGTSARASEPRIEFAPPQFADFTGVVRLGGVAEGCVYLTLGREFLEDLLTSLGEREHSVANCLDLAAEMTSTIASNARNHFGHHLTISVPRPCDQAAARQLDLAPTRFVLPLLWNHHSGDLVIALNDAGTP